MSSLYNRVRRGSSSTELVRSAAQGVPQGPYITLDQALAQLGGQFGYGGLSYGPGVIQTIQQNREQISGNFLGYVNGAYKSNGAVFACVLTRMLLFSEARFQFQAMNQGRAGKLFGTPALQILEVPWANGTTGDLLMRMEVDVSLAGNFYCTAIPDKRMKSGFRLGRLRPDWMTIILGSMQNPDAGQFAPDAELAGYIYTPGGPGSGADAIPYLPEQICHYAPIPDPLATYRGQSWLEPVITEIMGDRSMNTHKLMYFENGASPNLVVSMDTGRMDRKTFKEWVDTFEAEHSGSMNAYKTLYLGQGANATVVGANLKDLDYAITQGHGETRIASAGGIPAIIVGFSEGLEASTYSNFEQARRAFADKTLRPLWRNAAGSLQSIIEYMAGMPGSSRLWYDDRDIAFLKADAADAADIQLTQATAIRLLVDAGYDPDSITDAVVSNDFTLLKHSGLYSVQLQAPGANDSQNTGNGNGASTGGDTQNQLTKPDQTKANGESGLATTDRRATILANIDNVQILAKAYKAAKAGSTSK